MQRRRKLALALAAVLVLGTAYLVFELGRYQAGYSLFDHRRELERYRTQTAEQAATIDELKRQIAILQTSIDIDSETYVQLEGALSALETRLQAQEEELAFYRGIISPPDGEAGLRLQSLELYRGNGEQRWFVRVVLMQPIAQNERAAGVVTLRVDGRLDGASESLPLAALTEDDAVTELEYDFRYFQSLEQELVLPVGFEPIAVEVEVRPARPRGELFTQTFEWAALSGIGPEE